MGTPTIGPNGYPVWDKAPDAILDYGFDWQRWLASGDTIATSSWDIPTGITRVTDATVGAQTTVWLSGGTLGRTYQLTNTIVTTGGRTAERTLEIHIRQT